MKTFVLLCAALAAVLTLAACNGNGGDSPATPAAQSTPTAVPSLSDLCPKTNGEVIQTVVARLELGKSSFEQGEPIDMTLRLINCASEPITRIFPDAQRYDFVAKAEDGIEVWRRSSGMNFAQVRREETFEPAEQITFPETWDQLDNEGQPVEPGQYELTGESASCDGSLRNCGPRATQVIEITAP